MPPRYRRWGLIEIKAACDEVGHGDEVASGAIAAGRGLCGLDETVDAFENAVGDVGCEPAEDAIEVTTDRLGSFDHGGLDYERPILHQRVR